MRKNAVSHGTVHKVPIDLQKTLLSDKEVRENWESLTPLARNEWICWTISVKTPETRKKHIDRAKADLKAGKRRPCCWYGCIHRTDKVVSPSVRNLVLERNKKKQHL